jgi:hypothetical protein
MTGWYNRRALKTILSLVAAGLLQGCVYNPYTGTYVPCCAAYPAYGGYGYPAYGTYGYRPNGGYYGAPPAGSYQSQGYPSQGYQGQAPQTPVYQGAAPAARGYPGGGYPPPPP